MPSPLFSSVILCISLWILLLSPAQSLTCTSQKLPNNKQYANCSDLPTLDSYLHYTYNASNSSLSIAFLSTPASSDGWVAWAINPTATGMAGSQALIAFKSSGSLAVKTYNISSYSSIEQSNLSFDVWDLKAESGSNGTWVIYGSLKVPDKVEQLNQVWQIGARVSDGHPNKHEFAPTNLDAKETLSLVETPQSLTPASAPAPTPAPSPLSAPEKAGQSILRTNNLGLFLFLVSALAL